MLTALAVLSGCPNQVAFEATTDTPPRVVTSSKEYDAAGVKFTMIHIDSVTDITMGDSSQSENPLHQVRLTAYNIGETEVTQELFEIVMDANPSHFKDSPDKDEVREC